VCGVKLPSDHIRSSAEGFNKMRDKIPILTKILKGAVEITWTAEVEEGQ
jgi:hypothetical protein